MRLPGGTHIRQFHGSSQPCWKESAGRPPRRRAGSRIAGLPAPWAQRGIGALDNALRSLASTSDTRCQRQPPALVSPRAEDMMMATAEAKGEQVLGSRCHLPRSARRPGAAPWAGTRPLWPLWPGLRGLQTAGCAFWISPLPRTAHCTRGTILRAPDPGAHLSLPSSHPAIHPARLSREGFDDELASAHADPHCRSCPLTGARARGSGAASRRHRGGASAPVQDVYPLDRHMGAAASAQHEQRQSHSASARPRTTLELQHLKPSAHPPALSRFRRGTPTR